MINSAYADACVFWEPSQVSVIDQPPPPIFGPVVDTRIDAPELGATSLLAGIVERLEANGFPVQQLASLARDFRSWVDQQKAKAIADGKEWVD